MRDSLRFVLHVWLHSAGRLRASVAAHQRMLDVARGTGVRACAAATP